MTKINTKVQGFGPRASHTGPVRTPVSIGGKVALSEQSTPINPAQQQQYKSTCNNELLFPSCIELNVDATNMLLKYMQ